MKQPFLHKLEHVQIPVRKLEESIEWYTTNLGFRLQSKSDKNRHAFLTLSEGTMLMLWETLDDSQANFTVNGEIMPVLLFNTTRIHELFQLLKSLGSEITFYQNEGFGWVLKFIDPNGNMLGAIQYN
ncbi:VOC family protein [Paenibacillus sp. D2_2]|uniref:VOC family protein n=1 Tax=Paenibacillus sp. D2_2 TaxID=3073092 RepID=UPI00281569A2|nr:VOC family protein [Paenibacillus sp. D2_2]WMT43033.1 VOC family protein [Paenibacillus sp. D2_2]